MLKVEATTYKEAMPIIYTLIDGNSNFAIHPITGSIILFKPFEKVYYIDLFLSCGFFMKIYFFLAS